MKRAVTGLEIEFKAEAFGQIFPEKMARIIYKSMGTGDEPDAETLESLRAMVPAIQTEWINQPVIKLEERTVSRLGFTTIPSSVQQNVPAWALFGIFFIVVPMAGSLIGERKQGMLLRIYAAPISMGQVILGKAAAFLMVCGAQFTLIFFMGKFVLPLMGTPEFEIGPHIFSAAAVAVCAAFAAVSYGILLGAASKTFEQASMFGPISIVAAAALGGVMVPVYAMPSFMQKISAFSPLAWALNSFLDIFVKGGDILTVWPSLSLLTAFSTACLTAAWILLSRK